LVAEFDCGPAPYERHVTQWITETIWAPDFWQDGTIPNQTLLTVDRDADGKVAGFGTWHHVDAVADRLERHVEIAWFGVDLAHQGRRDDAGNRVAELSYRRVEEAALSHPRTTDEMPFTLLCDVDNGRGLNFWTSLGYQVLPDPRYRVEGDHYFRMVR
jgi:hypothetical protein